MRLSFKSNPHFLRCKTLKMGFDVWLIRVLCLVILWADSPLASAGNETLPGSSAAINSMRKENMGKQLQRMKNCSTKEKSLRRSISIWAMHCSKADNRAGRSSVIGAQKRSLLAIRIFRRICSFFGKASIAARSSADGAIGSSS